MRLLIVLGVLVAPAISHSQAPARACPDSTFFEFQVTRGAHWIADTSLAVHRLPPSRNPANLVQFVVDTTGIPILRSFRVLKVSDRTLIADVRSSLGDWRFTPSTSDGCKVRQYIQTPVGR